MEPTIGQQLIAFRERSGLSLKQIAQIAGYKAASSVQAFFNPDYDVRPLRSSVALRLAEVFAGRGNPPIDFADVLKLSMITPDMIAAAADRFPVVDPTPTLRGQPKDIPVYTSALAADMNFDDAGNGSEAVEMTVFAMNEIVAHVRRPPGLDAARKVYAVLISGSSMEPRYRPGDPVFVDPQRPPSIGDDVIIQLHAKDESQEVVTGLIKTLVRRSSTYVELEQYHPPLRFRIEAEDMSSIHRVIPWREAFGM